MSPDTVIARSLWEADSFGGIVLRALASDGQVSEKLDRMIRRSVTRLLDSDIIVESSCRGISRPMREITSPIGVPDALLTPIEPVIEMIAQEGLNPHLLSLLRCFAKFTHRFFASEDQQQKIRGWAAEGFGSAFMMSDRGGPSLQNWNSQIVTRDGQKRLEIDKVWIMAADQPGFGIVAVRADNGMYPIPYLLSPDQCAQLTRQATGEPFLGGLLQLGSVRGSVAVEESDRIANGGITMINQLLTTVRPFFVRGVLAHFTWLARTGQVLPTATQMSIAEELQAIAIRITACRHYSNVLLQQVLALKFACNELMTDLVAEDSVIIGPVGRDLLGFSKMEGSSYRCFRELYGRVAPPLGKRK